VQLRGAGPPGQRGAGRFGGGSEERGARVRGASGLDGAAAAYKPREGHRGAVLPWHEKERRRGG
jgi:hypothetical protein